MIVQAKGERVNVPYAMVAGAFIIIVAAAVGGILRVKAGRTVLTASDTMPYTLLIDGIPKANAGDSITQPVGTTRGYALRHQNGPDFCPIKLTIEFDYQRICARCDVATATAKQVPCR